MRGLDPRIHLLCKKVSTKEDGLPGISAFTRVFDALCPAMTTWAGIDHAAAADLPIAAFTRGMTSSAINCIERLLSAGSTQSMPA